MLLSNTTPYQAPAGQVALNYGVTVTLDPTAGHLKKLTVSNMTSTMAAPTNAFPGAVLTIDMLNSSGGVVGTITTWNTIYKLAWAFTAPANAARRTISFYYDGTNWIEIETSRSPSDIT